MKAEVIAVDELPAEPPPHVVRRIAHMAGLGRGLALDPKPFFKMNTALTTSPHFFAYAYRPRMSKAEAMQRMMDRYG
ncbi:hypothetical protein P9A30_gp42 [Sphingomonas phage Lucius]|uniref:Uncharacterized protein n=1 Tax=Sphingomonas phage Lucius TaxID=2686313 RepID=A0A6M3T8E7_9CAUD|nr:hypothetical protein P9A30_gp42 [Sphingomonas phage Lucius]QJD54484.1 hypothetical protein [Sphingomonas phage Lucius]